MSGETFTDWLGTLKLEFGVSSDGDVIQRWVSPWELSDPDDGEQQ